MLTRTILSTALLLLTLSACTSPQSVSHTPDDELRTKLDAIGQHAIDHENIVGLSIAVRKDGQLIYASGFGHADIDRTIPADEHTIYDVASVGKQFTAVATLLLIEEGKLRLDDRARDWVPQLPPHFPNATIDQLLRHTSGFVGAELDESDPPESYTSKRYGLDLLDDAELISGSAQFEPQENWVYCNPGYLVLGIIIEQAAQKRYDHIIRDLLLEPNDLSDMRVCERADPPRMAHAINHTDQGYEQVPLIDMTAYAGQGSICSSVIDLLRWTNALNTHQILNPKSLNQFRSPSPIRSSTTTAWAPYGTAQRIGEFAGHHKVGHTGTFAGGSASLTNYTDDNIEIAVLSNTNGKDVPHARAIEQRVAMALFDITQEDLIQPTRPITQDIKDAIAGTYTNGTVFTASFDGDQLVVSINNKEVERLDYKGNLTFQSPSSPAATETFIMDGHDAGWWIYNMSGDFIEVLRRIPDSNQSPASSPTANGDQ